MRLPETSKFLDKVEDTDGFEVSYDDRCGSSLYTGIVTVTCETGASIEIGVDCAVGEGLVYVGAYSTFSTLGECREWFDRRTREG
jgi:hypothetical protein